MRNEEMHIADPQGEKALAPAPQGKEVLALAPVVMGPELGLRIIGIAGEGSFLLLFVMSSTTSPLSPSQGSLPG